MGYARNRSRTACFNEGFLKQAILGSKRLAEEQVDTVESVALAMAKNHPQGKSLLQALKKDFAVTESSG